MLERSRCKLQVNITPLFLKDSLDLTEGNLNQIERVCRNSPSRSIVVNMEQTPWCTQPHD